MAATPQSKAAINRRTPWIPRLGRWVCFISKVRVSKLPIAPAGILSI